MEENVFAESDEKLLDIDDETLAVRVAIVREALEEAAVALRTNLKEQGIEGEVSEGVTDDYIKSLNENEQFRAWMVTNLILKLSDSDPNNSSINRLLYTMYEHYNGDIRKVIATYDVKLIRNSNGSISYDMTVLEEVEE